jgi:hypothetical protein
LQAPEDLFNVRFVGDGGQYEAGKLAATQKLPRNALAVVQQLLVWLPQELGVYWLFAEVLNATGLVEEAAFVLNDLSGPGRDVTAPELREHRRVLEEAVAAQLQAKADNPGGPSDAPKDPQKRPMTDVLATAGVGALAGMLVMGFIMLQVREVRRRRPGDPARRG